MSKYIENSVMFIHNEKYIIRVYYDIFCFFSWSFNYISISESFNKLFNLQEKTLVKNRL